MDNLPEPDPNVRLTNETRRRGAMFVVTDRASWRVDYRGEIDEVGAFHLSHRAVGDGDFRQQPQTFPGDPAGMAAARAHIEEQDARTLGGEPRGWCIHFPPCEEDQRSAWTLPWRPGEADFLDRLFVDLEEGGI